MKNLTQIFNLLHDSGISEMNFDFLNRKAQIGFLLWDDIRQKEVKLYLALTGMHMYTSESEPNVPFQVVGCHSALFKQIDENNFEITFLFDFLKQAVAWKVSLRCENVLIKGGLSKKAIEHKLALMNEIV